MKTEHMPTPSPVDLATTAIRLGRALSEMALGARLGSEGHNVEIVSQTLLRLTERAPFDPRDEQSFDIFRALLEAELASEVVGVERRPYETRFDEFGQHGEVRDCPIYSERGQELLAVRGAFTVFIGARNAMLDRIAAERAVRQILAS